MSYGIYLKREVKKIKNYSPIEKKLVLRRLLFNLNEEIDKELVKNFFDNGLKEEDYESFDNETKKVVKKTIEELSEAIDRHRMFTI